MHTTPDAQPPLLGLQQPRSERHRDAHRPEPPRQYLDVVDELVGPQLLRRRHDSQQHPHASARERAVLHDSLRDVRPVRRAPRRRTTPGFKPTCGIWDRTSSTIPTTCASTADRSWSCISAATIFATRPGWDALANVRTMMQTEFGYDPYIIGDHFFGDLAPGAAASRRGDGVRRLRPGLRQPADDISPDSIVSKTSTISCRARSTTSASTSSPASRRATTTRRFATATPRRRVI